MGKSHPTDFYRLIYVMIVDTMTFQEISEHLWKTSFSRDAMIGVEDIYRKNREKYQKEIKKWERNPVKDQYRIFKPVHIKRHNEDPLTVVFYSNGRGYVYLVCFTTFWHQSQKYLAFRPSEEGRRIVYFTWHSLKRYATRFLGDPEATLDDVFLGDILIFNNQTVEREYTYDGKTTIALITTDGTWLCEKHENYIIAKTFIGEKEYFKEQRELDLESIEILKKYKQEVWGDTIDRD